MEDSDDLIIHLPFPPFRFARAAALALERANLDARISFGAVVRTCFTCVGVRCFEVAGRDLADAKLTAFESALARYCLPNAWYPIR